MFVDYTKPVTKHVLQVALEGRGGHDVLRMLLDSGSQCDKASIDILADKDDESLTILKSLTESNVQEDAKAHFRAICMDVDVGWDQVLNADRSQISQKLSVADIRHTYFKAARFGRVQVLEDCIKMIYEEKGDLNISMVDQYQDTALHRACKHGHSKTVEILVREGIDIDHGGRYGATALSMAVAGMHYECAGILLRNGCDVRIADEKYALTALHLAARGHESKILEILIRHPISQGPSLYQRTKRGCTPLLIAAEGGSLAVIRSIIHNFAEASTNERDNNHATCLHLACFSGSLEAMTFFIDQGLHVNEFDDCGSLPVNYALSSEKNNSSQSIKLLHSHGADLSLSNDKGDILLFALIRQFRTGDSQDWLDCIMFVLDHIPDINHCDSHGRNALHWLARSIPEFMPSPYIEIICSALLKRGCSLTKRDKIGRSAFQLFVARWSDLSNYSSGLFNIRIDWMQESEHEEYSIPQYDRLRPQVAILMRILSETKADPTILGPPEDIQCRGSSLLSLAVRTANKKFMRAVLDYDNDVNREDEPPGFGSVRLRTPLQWMCALIAEPNRDLMQDFVSFSKAPDYPHGYAPIHVAARFGNNAVLTEILRSGAAIDSLCSKGYSPLMYACRRSHLSTIRLLYEHGARVTITNQWDALALACVAGDVKVLATLYELPELDLDWKREFLYHLDIGPRFYWCTSSKFTVTYLILAAYARQAQVVTWLIDNSLTLDVNTAIGKDYLTPLYCVVGNKHSYKTILPCLLSMGADTSKQSLMHQWTPLHAAAEAGNTKVIKVLLANGANVNAKDTRHFTPQLVAIEHDKVEAARLLTSHAKELPLGSNVNIAMMPRVNDRNSTLDEIVKYGYRLQQLGPPLHRATEAGDLRMVQKLLDEDAHPDSRLPDCTTPAMKAAWNGDYRILDLLKERGADLTAKDIYGQTALHFACSQGHNIVIPGLLACGLSLTHPDLYGGTPLHRAVLWGDAILDLDTSVMRSCGSSLKCLSPPSLRKLANHTVDYANNRMLQWILEQLDEGSKYELLNSRECYTSLLQFASALGHSEIADTLIKAGADIDCLTETHDTPLACAARMGRTQMVHDLAGRGARLDYVLPDGTQVTAIDAAERHPPIQRWLRSFFERKANAISAPLNPIPRNLGTINEEEEPSPVPTHREKRHDITSDDVNAETIYGSGDLPNIMAQSQ